MPQRLLVVGSALVRIVLVIVAFGLAVGSIALSSVRGFCPEPEGALVAATIVEETEAPLEVDPDEPAPPSPGETAAPGDEAPATEAPDQPVEDGTVPPEDQAGACPGGVSRCLPPLLSSVLIIGDGACNDQAPARLRSILVPAFVGSTALLAGAWWLRPSRLPRGPAGREPARGGREPDHAAGHEPDHDPRRDRT